MAVLGMQRIVKVKGGRASVATIVVSRSTPLCRQSRLCRYEPSPCIIPGLVDILTQPKVAASTSGTRLHAESAISCVLHSVLALSRGLLYGNEHWNHVAFHRIRSYPAAFRVVVNAGTQIPERLIRSLFPNALPRMSTGHCESLATSMGLLTASDHSANSERSDPSTIRSCCLVRCSARASSARSPSARIVSNPKRALAF